MMTQSVMTQAANLFGNAAQGVTSKGKQSNAGFDLIINSSMKSTQASTDNSENSTVRKTSSKNTNIDNSSKSDVQSDAAKQAEKAGNKDVKTEAVTRYEKQNARKQVAETTEGEGNVQKEDPTLEEQVISEIAVMLQTIQQVVMNSLNLSEEELKQLLTDQGMSMTDLLQTDSLQQLVLANNGSTDILSVLTDETLADKLKNLLQTVNSIKSEADLGITEEQMKAMLEDSLKQGITHEETTDLNTFLENLVNKEELVNPNQDVSMMAKSEQSKDASSQFAQEVRSANTLATATSETQESSPESQFGANQEEKSDLEAQDPFQSFIDNMVKVTSQNELQINGEMTQVTEIRNIANQILERIKVTVTTDQTSMEMQLNPEHLGKVNLSIQSKDGVMTAQFVVQNEISKEAIESQISTLKETLNQQGIKVEAIEVTVATYSFEQQNQQGTNEQADAQKNNSHRRLSMEDALNMSDTPEEFDIAQDITGATGSQIDYTA